MKNSIFLMAFLMVGLWTLAQDQQSASATLRELKHGSLIVRLKTNQKSVDAYRRAGKQQIAQRIEEERRSQNQRIYWAFKGYFRFCKVYFIYAYETMNFLKGTPGLLLNQNLDPDSSIIFSDSSFVFCEYGSAQPFADFGSQPFENSSADKLIKANANTEPAKDAGIPQPTRVEKSTATATTSGLVLSDKNLHQLERPFPYVIPVLGENYNGPVKSLTRELERAYGRLVIRRDYKEKVKEMKKRQKAQMKSLQN